MTLSLLLTRTRRGRPQSARRICRCTTWLRLRPNPKTTWLSVLREEIRLTLWRIQDLRVQGVKGASLAMPVNAPARGPVVSSQ